MTAYAEPATMTSSADARLAVCMDPSIDPSIDPSMHTSSALSATAAADATSDATVDAIALEDAWGANNYGQLGTGGVAQSLSPIQVNPANLTNVTQVSAGWEHNLALRAGSLRLGESLPALHGRGGFNKPVGFLLKPLHHHSPGFPSLRAGTGKTPKNSRNEQGSTHHFECSVTEMQVSKLRDMQMIARINEFGRRFWRIHVRRAEGEANYCRAIGC